MRGTLAVDNHQTLSESRRVPHSEEAAGDVASSLPRYRLWSLKSRPPESLSHVTRVAARN
jgi:hypothetical protein